MSIQKNDQVRLRCEMEKSLFDDLQQSLKEAKAISEGKVKASRCFNVESTDVKAVRERVGLTQMSSRSSFWRNNSP